MVPDLMPLVCGLMTDMRLDRDRWRGHAEAQHAQTDQADRGPAEGRRQGRDLLGQRLTGFGVRVQPSGTKSFIVNYRPGDGGRKAPNKRVVIGRYGRIAPDRARRLAQDLLGRVARGEDPAGERAEARGVPLLADAFEVYMAANPNRAADTVRLYRRPCVDHESLRNPVELWLAAGGRFNRQWRRRISAPNEVLPRWRTGIEAADLEPAIRDIFLVGFYTGMRRGEILSLRWERVDLDRRILRVEETKTGEPLELPVTRQLASVFERRLADGNGPAAQREGWVFPSSRSGASHVVDLVRFYGDITEAGGTRFWFHGLRNAFITVAERELMLPRSLTKRLVNHAQPSDVTEGYAADWTIPQLREPAQRIADRIDELMKC